MAIIICALLAVGAIGFTLLVRDQDIPPAPVENPELKHLETRRQVLLENLRDLQFEYHQGKLSDEDYQSLKAGFLYDLAGVMDSMERLQPVKAASVKDRPSKSTQLPVPKTVAEAEPKAKPAATAVTALKCPACAFLNPTSNRFCGGCGAALL